MDTGRLTRVLGDVIAEAASLNLASLTQGLVSTLSTLLSQPNPNNEQKFRDTLTELEASLEQ
jgi:hypothetical protein